MKIPVKRKCKNHKVCKQTLIAEMIPSDPDGNPWRVFFKSIAVFRCPVCDMVPDPQSHEVHKQITDESGTM